MDMRQGFDRVSQQLTTMTQDFAEESDEIPENHQEPPRDDGAHESVLGLDHGGRRILVLQKAKLPQHHWLAARTSLVKRNTRAGFAMMLAMANA